MSLRSVKRSGTARIAVVGAPTEDGSRLREALERVGVPGERVDLYGASEGELVLSEYAGEARIVQEPDVQEIAQHDVVFLCEPSRVARDIVAAAGPTAAVIDLVGCAPGGLSLAHFHMDIHPATSAVGESAVFAVPHPLSLLLAEVLHPLDRELGLSEAIAVILRPASDFGEPGVEELREQTIRLLSFAKVPVETFGRQLAFNIIPQGSLPAAQPALEARIAAEVQELLRWPESRLATKLLTAPLFYGHGLQLRVKLRTGTSLDEVREALARSDWLDGESDAPSTPIEVTGEVGAHLAELAEDGLGGFWMWIVAGETASKSAEQAVRLAEQLSDL